MAKRSNHSSRRSSWKMERASVHRNSSSRPRTNKYRPRPADTTNRPSAGSTARFWRGGYHRKNGTYVQGHYVTNPNHKG
jgi:hypothetical protein